MLGGVKPSARAAGIGKETRFRWLREAYVGLRAVGLTIVEAEAALGFSSSLMPGWEQDRLRAGDGRTGPRRAAEHVNVAGAVHSSREPRRRLRRQSGMSVRPDRTPRDAELLAAVAEGDPEAFGALYDQHAPWLLVRLRRRTTDLDVADQVAQETFLVVWRDAGRFRGQGAVGAWIWGIAIRRLLDVQRGRAAQERLAGLLGRRGYRMRPAPRSRPLSRWSTAR